MASQTKSDDSETAPKKMVRLKSSDEVEFVVEEAVAIQSQTIKNIIHNHAEFAAEKPIKPIYLRGSTSKILSKVIEYCEKHAGITATTTTTTTVPDGTTTLAKATAILKEARPGLRDVFRDCWNHIEDAKAATTNVAAGASLLKVAASLTESAAHLSAAAARLTIAAAATKHASPSSAEGGRGGGDCGGDELKVWDAEFVKGMEPDTLFEVLSAAAYLNIEGLLDLCCESLAKTTRGKTPVEIRKIFVRINQKYDTQSQIKVMKEKGKNSYEGISP